jgi:hypothetical protein
MKRLVLLAFACLPLAVLAVGCGGGGGTESSGGGFAAAANAACSRANQKVAALAPPQSEAQLLSYLEETEGIVEGLQREIAALDGTGGAVEAYLAALEESATVLNEMSNSARSRNLGAVGELADQLAQLRLARLAEAAGLATCAKAPAVQP